MKNSLFFAASTLFMAASSLAPLGGCEAKPKAGAAECQKLIAAYNEFAEMSLSFSGNVKVATLHTGTLKTKLEAIQIPAAVATLKTEKAKLLAKITEAHAAGQAGNGSKMTGALQEGQNAMFAVEAECKRIF